jgi:hypothetical protein
LLVCDDLLHGFDPGGQRVEVDRHAVHLVPLPTTAFHPLDMNVDAIGQRPAESPTHGSSVEPLTNRFPDHRRREEGPNRLALAHP